MTVCHGSVSQPLGYGKYRLIEFFWRVWMVDYSVFHFTVSWCIAVAVDEQLQDLTRIRGASNSRELVYPMIIQTP